EQLLFRAFRRGLEQLERELAAEQGRARQKLAVRWTEALESPMHRVLDAGGQSGLRGVGLELRTLGKVELPRAVMKGQGAVLEAPFEDLFQKERIPAGLVHQPRAKRLRGPRV